MTGAQRPAAVCARCGMAINYMLKTTGRQDDPEFVWVHGDPADHDPVLAPSSGQPRLYCDFCSAPDPGWVIDTDRDFQITVVDRDGGSLTENFTDGPFRGRLRRRRRPGCDPAATDGSALGCVLS